jgi:hypothetical protein
MQQPQRLASELVAQIFFRAETVVVDVREVSQLTSILPSSAAQAAQLHRVEFCSKGIPTPERQVFLAMMHFQETRQVAVQVEQELNPAELLRFLDPQLFMQRVVITGPGKISQIHLGHLRMDLVALPTTPTA